MKKYIASFVATFALVAGFAAVPTTAFALEIGGDKPVETGADTARSAEQPSTLLGDGGTIGKITNILLYVVGAIAVIMIVVGGLRYVISGGNQTQITAAKNTILYAVVGLIIAILAYAIINFVLGTFTAGGSGGTNL